MFPNAQTNERELIRQLSRQLAAYLDQSFPDAPRCLAARFPAIALASATENPYLPIETLQKMVEVTVWIFAVDALIDEKILPEPELTRRLAVYEEIVRGRREDADGNDPCGKLLLRMIRQLQARPHYPRLRFLWEKIYARMIQGMLFEASPGTEVVGLAQYLYRGQYSVGLPLYVVSAWILQSGQDSLQHLKDLVRMMRLSGLCVRLANDLRTCEKERAERNLNAVLLKEQEWLRRGEPSEVARQLALEAVTNLRNAHLERFLALEDPSMPLNVSLVRLTLFSVGFYSQYDFHTVSASELDQEFRTHT